MLMMVNFGSKPKRKLSAATDIVMTICFRYFFHGLVAAVWTAAGVRFFCINCYTKNAGVAGFEIG